MFCTPTPNLQSKRNEHKWSEAMFENGPDVKNSIAAKCGAKKNEVLSGWSATPSYLESAEFESNYLGISEWSMILKNKESQSLQSPHQLPKHRFRGRVNISGCSVLFNTTTNGISSIVGLSDYLKHLNLILSRNKSLSAGCTKQSHRPDEGNCIHKPTRAAEVGGVSSAPTTLRKQSMYRSYSRGSTNTSGYTVPPSSNIPCKNYRKLHKHRSYSDLQDCCHQAQIDSQHKCGHVRDNANPDTSHSTSHSTSTNHSTSHSTSHSHSTNHSTLHSTNDCSNDIVLPTNTNSLTQSASSEKENGNSAAELDTNAKKCTKTMSDRNNEDLGEGLESTATAMSSGRELSTMHEYIEKYYRPERRVPVRVGRKVLPIIPENEHRLVENILTYRHSSSGGRESTHKNRYLQFTSMEIRRTTAQLLKSSLHRNVTHRTTQQTSATSLQANETFDGSVTANLTLTQLMAPKVATELIAAKARKQVQATKSVSN